jgi:hypothetical protein
MKRIPWDWRLLKLVLTSRGVPLKEVPALLPEDLFPDRKGLAEKTLQANVTDGKEARRDIAEYLAATVPTRPGYEKTAKVVRLGLAAFRGESFRVIGKRLDAHGGKLDKLLSEVEAIRLALKGFLHVTATVLLLGGLGFAGHHLRAGMTSGETASATRVPPASDAVNGATGASEVYAAGVRAVLGALLDLGKKEVKEKEFWIPKDPFPFQKLEKDCNPDLGESPINGGCWVQVANMAPPCKLLFRHGNACFRPVSADPNKPVGMFPDSSGQQ